VAVYVSELYHEGTDLVAKLFADTLSELHNKAGELWMSRTEFVGSPPSNVPHYPLTDQRDRALETGVRDASSAKWWDEAQKTVLFWYENAHADKAAAGVDEDATEW
jgi:hypothetical protein